MKEKPEDTTSKADPSVKQPAAAEGGFPEDLEPNVELPVPVVPAVPEPPAQEGSPQ